MDHFSPPFRGVNCYNSWTDIHGKMDAAGGVVKSAWREAPLLKIHKYTIGQNVRYTSGPFGRFGASGSFKIVKLLPPEGDEHQYRIKSTGEAFERVAKESQLDRER
jgi:hypothetical protein